MHTVRRSLPNCVFGILALALASALPGQAFAQTAPKTGTKPAASSRPAPTRTSLARAAAVERARRAALARKQQEELLSPRYKLDLAGNQVPDVRAAAAIIYNPTSGEVLWEANSHAPRSIASLTKIMTALTFMADGPNLDQPVKVIQADTLRASVTYLRAGDIVTNRDLLHLTLIASDNAAARVLARTAEGGTAAFIARMNGMAKALGLTNTQYADPSGLDARNISTAYDISHLIAFATADERVGPIMRQAEYTVRTSRRQFTVRSTNRLLGTDLDVRAAKTGFIQKAGYCLATLLQVPQGSEVAVVVLGAANSAMRFAEVRNLLNWVAGRTLIANSAAAATPED